MSSFLYELNKETMIEVRSTGRFVTKPLMISGKSCRMIEITPIDVSLKWTKFVDENELQIIQYDDGYVEKDNILRIV